MGLLENVEAELSAAIGAAVGDEGRHDPLLRRSDFADLQANFALAMARKLGTQPRELAAKVVGRLEGSKRVTRGSFTSSRKPVFTMASFSRTSSAALRPLTSRLNWMITTEEPS